MNVVSKFMTSKKKKITAATRVKAVREVLAGRKISEVAESYSVNRSSVCRWLKKSQEAIVKSLQPHSRGPKKNAHQVVRLKEKVTDLKKLLRARNKRISLLEKKLDEVETYDPRPAFCPECGCEKLYKNGTYRIPLSKIIPPEEYFNKKIPVKRFICPACNNPTFLDYPAILYHSIFLKKQKNSKK